MFERFTDPARQVIVLAREEALILRHDFIGTEHLLLGLVRESDGIAARVLQPLDLTVELVRAQVARIIGTGEGFAAGQMPFTPRAKKVLELSMGEALALQHDYLGPEHILLGLLREGEGVANRILADVGANPERVREAVLRTPAEPPPDEARRTTTVAPGSDAARRTLERPGELFARFTERGRRVVVLALEEARSLNQGYIGTEHILLGLMRVTDGRAAGALESLGVTLEGARERLLERAPEGTETAPQALPFTPLTERVLELAARDALAVGDDRVDTEHVLLALAREDESLAARILLDFDTELALVREAMLGLLSRPAGRRPVARRGPPATRRPPETAGVDEPGLDELLDGSGPALRALSREIEAQLGRAPDAGDVLVVLTLVPEGLAARALAALGVEAEQLARAADAGRSEPRPQLLPAPPLLGELAQLRRETTTALEAGELARAAELRERQRVLLEQIDPERMQRQEDMLARARRLLGLQEG